MYKTCFYCVSYVFDKCQNIDSNNHGSFMKSKESCNRFENNIYSKAIELETTHINDFKTGSVKINKSFKTPYKEPVIDSVKIIKETKNNTSYKKPKIVYVPIKKTYNIKIKLNK